jgi:hypothetical protein
VKWSERLGLAAASFAVAFVVATAATGFLGVAAFFGLEAEGLRPAAAAAIVGVGGLVLAVLIGLVARHFLSPAAAPRSPTASSGNAVNDAAADLGMLAAQQIVSATRKHPYTSIGAALIAGLAVGAIPELRKTLTDLLKR